MKELSRNDKRDLSRTFLKAIMKYYADPANVAKFEEWKKGKTNGTENNGSHSSDSVGYINHMDHKAYCD